ncbi:NrfD/PsrC family molybdoenzyme membrane anchor subunit [Planctomycetota bacterium]
MKQIRIDTLLATPQDEVTYQSEWSLRAGFKGSGLLLLIALFAGNLGPGLYMIGCFYKFELGLLIAFGIVSIGYGLTHLLFLGRSERFWRALLKPQNSWISRGFLFATFFLIFGFLSVAHYLPWFNVGFLKIDAPGYNVILGLGFISAFLLSLYPGFLFSCVKAIPFWNSGILAPLFVVQSIGAGIALTFILSHLPGAGISGIDELLPYETVVISVSAVLIGIYLWGRSKKGGAGKVAVEQLLYGRYRKVFLWGAMFCEIIIPLVMALAALMGLNAVFFAAAELIQLGGIFFFKYSLLNVGAYNELYNFDVMKASKERAG